MLTFLNRSLIPFLKTVYRLAYQFLLHCLDASYDLYRYLKYSNSLHPSTRDRQKLESLLFFNYHKIEKALALPEIKPLFGLEYIDSVLDLMEKWVQLTGDLDAIVFRGAYASLVSYRECVAETLTRKYPDLIHRIDEIITDYRESGEDLDIGGTLKITAKELQTANQSIHFEDFVLQRHSVRNFSSINVPDSVIIKAVKIAQRSPSVCNRQCSRIHVFSSDAAKAIVLRHQNGNKGFGHKANRVILITADTRSFVSSGERNQAFIDSSLFAMTLIYAFQSQGVTSCCLNTCTSYFQDIALRRACRIPKWEIPIMMIAIGYPPDSVTVAASARVSTESILTFQDLDAEGLINKRQ